MTDAIYVGLGLGLFALSWGMVRLFGRLAP